MERKTKILAEDGRRDLTITRDFDLAVDLVFRAYSEADLVEQWMGTKVLKLENRNHGGYEFATSDPQGNVVFRANGTIHEVVLDRRITRTFEMEDAPFCIQLEFLEFESLTPGTSRLTIHTLFRSAEMRDQLMKLPFASGLNMAHDRLQEIAGKAGTALRKTTGETS